MATTPSSKPQTKNLTTIKGNFDGDKMILREGKEVEATSDEAGFKGGWFTVTILSLPGPEQSNSEGKALVQYKNILEDDNENEMKLTKKVKLSYIRPLPPRPKIPGDQFFQVNDVVDAFQVGGWWTGSVSKAFDNPKRYVVSLADTKKDVEFSPSELRPHLEWVDGKWVKFSKVQEVSDCTELSSNTTPKDAGITAQLDRSDALKCRSKMLEPCSVTSRKNEMGQSTASKQPANATPLHPSKKSKHGSSANSSSVPDSKMKVLPNIPSIACFRVEKGQDLPFVKSLPMWKDVESMEIFQAMPQNPHFRPLDKFNEILREGIAVGHMLSFTSMVERTSKLTVADPRIHFTTILDVLPDFEILGFDVKAVRDRTSNLVLMKERHERLQGHSKELKLQVKQYYDDLTEITETIEANCKKMRELEEKQALLLPMKESKTSQITTLQVSSDAFTRDIQVVEKNFESLANSPWY